MDVEKIIQETVNETVLALKMNGLITPGKMSAYQKTEELLRNYQALTMSDNEKAKKTVCEIDRALGLIQQDPYYNIILMAYFSDMTREQIADQFNTSVTTISRNKARLVNRLKAALFSEEFITEIFN